MKSHYKKLERMYLSARCNEYYNPKIEIKKGETDLVIPVKEDFYHAAGAVHGSVYFKAMDDAAFFAANSLIKDVFVLTVSFTVYFVRPITEGHLNTIGRVTSRTKQLLIAESVIVNDHGKEIGRGSGQFIKSSIPLSEEINYL